MWVGHLFRNDIRNFGPYVVHDTCIVLFGVCVGSGIDPIELVSTVSGPCSLRNEKSSVFLLYGVTHYRICFIDPKISLHFRMFFLYILSETSLFYSSSYEFIPCLSL